VTISDEVTMTEHFIRRGNYLTNITVLRDPVYMTESFIRSSTWVLDPTLQFVRYPCGPNEVGRRDSTDRQGTVPHVLPGENTMLTDFASHYGLPIEASQGGCRDDVPRVHGEDEDHEAGAAACKPAAAAAAASNSSFVDS
jgi:hypothetical protein